MKRGIHTFGGMSANETRDWKTHFKNNMAPFGEYLGIEFIEATPDRVLAEVKVSPELSIDTNTIHGGAIMAISDTVASCGAIANLRQGQWTTTLESKTNFFGPAPSGTHVLFESLPLHLGRRTSVWQTSMRNDNGKLLAQVTQTQMTMGKPKEDS